MEGRAREQAPGAPLPFVQGLHGTGAFAKRRRKLPLLPDRFLPEVCAGLDREQAAMALAHRILPVQLTTPAPGYAVADNMAAAAARRMGWRVVARVNGEALGQALSARFSRSILRQACYGMAQRTPEGSAVRLVRPGRRRGVFLGSLLAGLAVAVLPGLLPVACFLLFLPLACLRLASLLAPPSRASRARLPDAALPSYSVLVALHHEAAILPQLVDAMCALDYPVGKLDIKLVLEADDRDTQQALAKLSLPGHFELIRVPPAQPRTKPKALNYALAFARGELLTIFDAEDIPDVRQLRLAAESFAAGGPDLGCLQARLCIYNRKRNWLTGQFALEYAMLFDLLLPFLAWLRLPIPLGGTSNHFRTDVLRRLGAWDPFNVTEDADLGLRLARAGLRTQVLAASTAEEAPWGLRNWMQQRARWMKGFVQTWAVHSRAPRQTIANMGLLRFGLSQMLMAGTFLSALLYAPLTLRFLAQLATGQYLHADPGQRILLLLSLFIFTSGHVFLQTTAAQAGLIRMKRVPVGLIASLPFYWMLMSAAAWLALWQLFANPFHWNKTKHG